MAVCPTTAITGASLSLPVRFSGHMAFGSLLLPAACRNLLYILHLERDFPQRLPDDGLGDPHRMFARFRTEDPDLEHEADKSRICDHQGAVQVALAEGAGDHPRLDLDELCRRIEALSCFAD